MTEKKSKKQKANEPTVKALKDVIPVEKPVSRNRLAVVALVFGIIALVGGWVPFWGVVFGLVAVVLGIVAFKKQTRRAISLTGLVTGVVAIVGGAIMTTLILLGVVAFLGFGFGSGVLENPSIRNVSDRMDALNEQNKARIDAKKDFSKGETATFDAYKVKVNTVNLAYTPEDESIVPSDGRKFIVVNLTIGNNTDRTVAANPYLFRILDNSNEKVPSYIEGPTPFENGSLSRGASTTGDIVFEVDASTQEFKLTYLTHAYKNSEYVPLTYTLAF